MGVKPIINDLKLIPAVNLLWNYLFSAIVEPQGWLDLTSIIESLLLIWLSPLGCMSSDYCVLVISSGILQN